EVGRESVLLRVVLLEQAPLAGTAQGQLRPWQRLTDGVRDPRFGPAVEPHLVGHDTDHHERRGVELPQPAAPPQVLLRHRVAARVAVPPAGGVDERPAVKALRPDWAFGPGAAERCLKARERGPDPVLVPAALRGGAVQRPGPVLEQPDPFL